MANLKLPNPLERRHLLERELEPSRALRYADLYLEGERPVEAVEFLAKAGADDRLEQLADQAVETGDAFLLRRVYAVRDLEPGPERWKKLAENADAAGLSSYAETARRAAEVGGD